MARARSNQQRVEELYDQRLSTASQRLTKVLAEVKELATRASLEPSAFSYSEDVLEDFGLERRYLAFGVEGTYPELRQLIHLLESSESFLTLEQVGLAEVGGNRGKLRINLRLSTLLFRRGASMMRRSPILLLLFVLSTGGCQEAARSPRRDSPAGPAATAGRHRVRGTVRRTGPPTPALAIADLPTLRLEALDREADPYTPGRDPFRYGEIPPPVPTGPSPEELARQQRERAEEDRRRNQAEPTCRSVAPPPFPLSYLGSFGPRPVGSRSSQDEEGNLLNALEGEVLEDKFRVAQDRLRVGRHRVRRIPRRARRAHRQIGG